MRYIYLLRDSDGNYKVGIAANVHKRLASIQTSNPARVSVVCCRLVEDAEKLEAKIHEYLAEHRAAGGREWFKLTSDQAIDVAMLINVVPDVKVMDRILSMQALLLKTQKEYAQIRQDVREIRAFIYASTRLKADRKSEPEAAVKIVEVPAPQPVGPSDDELEFEAEKLFRKASKASVSLLQRKLNIGYGRASRIMDRLEERGVVSAADGAHPRSVF